MFEGEGTSTPVIETPAGGEGGGGDEGLGNVGDAGEGTSTETEEGGGEGDEGDSSGEGDGEGDGTEGGESDEGDGEQQDDNDPDEFADADGRRVDDATRKALAALKKIDPAMAAKLGKDYHRTQAIIKDTGSKNLSEAIVKVRGAMATIESLGGEEGITALNEEVTDYRNEIKQFGEGDPGLIEQLYDSNKPGFVKSVQNSLDLLQTRDPAAFDDAMVGAMNTRLEQSGLYKAIEQAIGFVKEGKGQEAFDTLKTADDWFKKLAGLAKTGADKKTKVNPEADALARERAEVAAEKVRIQTDAINTDLNRMNNKAMSRIVEPFFKEMKLKDRGRRMFVNDVQTSVWDAMKEDKAFQRQAALVKSKGDKNRTVEFVHAKFAELLPDHFREVRNARYPTYKPGAPRVALNPDGTKKEVVKDTTKPGQPPKVQAVPGVQPTRPKHIDVDWNKTTDDMWIKGGAILVNGKQIKFDRNAPANRF